MTSQGFVFLTRVRLCPVMTGGPAQSALNPKVARCEDDAESQGWEAASGASASISRKQRRFGLSKVIHNLEGLLLHLCCLTPIRSLILSQLIGPEPRGTNQYPVLRRQLLSMP